MPPDSPDEYLNYMLQLLTRGDTDRLIDQIALRARHGETCDQITALAGFALNPTDAAAETLARSPLERAMMRAMVRTAQR